MPYDPELLYIDYTNEDGLLHAWYDQKYLGIVEDEEEAYELAINYTIGND